MVKMISRLLTTKHIQAILKALLACRLFDIETENDVVDDELESIVATGTTKAGKKIEVFRSLRKSGTDAWITRYAEHLFE